MRTLYWILVVACAALAIAFALQNLGSVTVSFFGYALTAPLAAVVVAIYLLGMLSGGTVVSFLRHSIHKATAKPAANARGAHRNA